MHVQDLAPWQDKLVVLTLDGGESTTAHILFVDTEYKDLIVDVLDSNRPYPGSDHSAFTIPFGRILSVHPASVNICPHHSLLPPDPCRTRPTFSLPRFILFTPIFLIMIPGSFFLFIFLADRPYGIQFASMVCYTAAVVLYTFSSNRGLQRYLFDCPFVRHQLPRLGLRHISFLVSLFVLQTAALQLREHLPASWLTASGRNIPPFIAILFILCAVLAFTQILTNRSLLNRAHLEYPSSNPTL